MTRQIQPHTAPIALAKTQQIGPKEVLAVIIRRRWVILGVAVPIIVVSSIGTMRSTDLVAASARVLIEAGQPENPTLSPNRVDYDVLMSTAAQIGMSLPVAQRAAVALMDSLPAIRAEDPRVPAVRNRKQLEGILLGGVDCSQVGESNILSIAFRHPSPIFSLSAVGALVDAYIAYGFESQQNLTAVDYYTDQIRMVQADIDSLMTLRSVLRREAGYSGLQVNAAAGINQIMALEQDFIRARSRREGIEVRLQGLLDAVAADPDYVPGSRAQENQNLVGLKSRLDEMKIALAELRIQYQEDSEWVRRQKELIEEARNDLHRERENYVADLRISLEEARQTEAVFSRAVTAMKAGIENYPDIERQIESLDLQIGTQRELLKALQLKRGEVRLKAQSDVRVSNIVLLDAPAIQMQVAGSKKMLYLGLAAAFAVALGFITAMFVETHDHRLYDPRNAEQVLEVPVLAAISRGTTRGSD